MSRQNFCACCVCFILTGKRVPHLTVIRGYAVCADHVELATKPEFNIFNLRPAPKGAV
jgi:hypothetical protein